MHYFSGHVYGARSLTFYRRRQRDIFGAVAVGLFVLTWGCSLRHREAVIYHAFDYPAPSRESKAPPIPQTLMIYRFLLDPSVESDAMRTAPAKFCETSRLVHRWQENPADMITDLFLRDMEHSGMFDKVVGQLSNVRYRYALEGTIRQLQGLTRTDTAIALVDMEVTFTDFEAPWGTKRDLFKKPYRVEVPSKDSSAEAMLDAFNQGIREISKHLRGDIKSALARTGAD